MTLALLNTSPTPITKAQRPADKRIFAAVLRQARQTATAQVAAQQQRRVQEEAQRAALPSSHANAARETRVRFNLD